MKQEKLNHYSQAFFFTSKLTEVSKMNYYIERNDL